MEQKIIALEVERTTKRYRVMDRFMLRTPLLPLSFVLDILASQDPYDGIERAFNNELVNEAIYLSSPTLHGLFDDEINNKSDNHASNVGLYASVLKYITRMSTRPTPFGLFAGVSLGHFDSVTDIIVTGWERRTRLDFSLIFGLARKMVNVPAALEHLRFYPNTSIYRASDDIRYIEVLDTAEGKGYIVQGIKNSEALDIVLSSAEQGKSLTDLSNLLVEQGFDKQESLQYIDQLIRFQVLISEIEPDTIGVDYHSKLSEVLQKCAPGHEITEYLKDTKRILSQLDKKKISPVPTYKKLYKNTASIGPTTKNKNIDLIQVDTLVKTGKCQLNRKTKITLSRALEVLSLLTPRKEGGDLSDFTEHFKNRYETREVPLMLALDVDLGLGYPVKKNKSPHPLIADISFGEPQKKRGFSFEHPRTFLLDKMKNWSSGELVIEDKDLEQFAGRIVPKLNRTVYGLGEIHSIEGIPHLYMNSIGGSSATNLLGRFSYLSPPVKEFVGEISNHEREEDKIVCEIAHLPEERTGNVLFRSNVRESTIRYISGVRAPSISDIDPNDLYLKVESERLGLFHGPTGKEVVPLTSTAHNYKTNKVPLYRFLCDWQFKGSHSALFFDWGGLFSLFDHFPRVRYKDVILSKETWKLSKDPSLKKYLELPDQQTMKAIDKWREEQGLPHQFQLVQGDNRLLLDLTCPISSKILIKEISKAPLVVQEVFIEKGTKTYVKDPKGLYHSAEYVFTFKKT